MVRINGYLYLLTLDPNFQRDIQVATLTTLWGYKSSCGLKTTKLNLIGLNHQQSHQIFVYKHIIAVDGRAIYTTWKESMASHSLVLVYHDPLLFASFWEWLAIDPFTTM